VIRSLNGAVVTSSSETVVAAAAAAAAKTLVVPVVDDRFVAFTISPAAASRMQNSEYIG